jgi:hypothetical protein
VVASGLVDPGGLVAGGSEVYWFGNATPPGVFSCPSSGCMGAPTAFATAVQPSPYPVTNVALTPTDVYWTNDDVVQSCSIAGCNGQPTTIASAQTGAAGIAVDTANVYWTTAGGAVLRCALGGCGGQPTAIAMGQEHPMAIATDGASVYWSDQAALMKCPVSGCGAGPLLLASMSAQAWGLAVDATSIYWTDMSAGTVMLLAK